MSTTAPPDKEAALAVLDTVIDPVSGQGLAAAGLVQALVVRDGRAGFMMEVRPEQVARYQPVRDAAEAALKAMPGVERVSVVLTAAAGPPPAGVTRVRRGASVAPDPQAQPRRAPQAERPAHVKRIIAVASGKGGVGKSTIAVNLACAFARLGLRAGLMDADVYGPSAPTMFGLSAEPVFEDGKLTPLQANGVKVMSIGFIVDEAQAMIWRGPMASSAVRQFLKDVRWGTEAEPLDVLVIDLPPGTGDIHLTLLQHASVDGAVVVTTPQEVALIDARRAAAMFAKMTPPIAILGLIENMAWFEDASGARVPIFGSGGGAAEAARLHTPLLAQIPLAQGVRESGDEGVPIVAADPDHPVSRAFLAAAERLAG
jgi:ATP-binding protein involved in chromosome partitioning